MKTGIRRIFCVPEYRESDRQDDGYHSEPIAPSGPEIIAAAIAFPVMLLFFVAMYGLLMVLCGVEF